MAREVSDRLTRWVIRSFEDGRAELVLAELRALDDIAVGGQDVERIQACVVLPTGGDWASFLRRLALVNRDWRDALVAADLAQPDWPKRLTTQLGA